MWCSIPQYTFAACNYCPFLVCRCIYVFVFVVYVWYNFVLFLGSVEDYHMLEKINKVSAAKYADVKNIVSNVNGSMQQLDTKCKYIYVCSVI